MNLKLEAGPCQAGKGEGESGRLYSFGGCPSCGCDGCKIGFNIDSGLRVHVYGFNTGLHVVSWAPGLAACHVRMQHEGPNM